MIYLNRGSPYTNVSPLLMGRLITLFLKKAICDYKQAHYWRLYYEYHKAKKTTTLCVFNATNFCTKFY